MLASIQPRIMKRFVEQNCGLAIENTMISAYTGSEGTVGEVWYTCVGGLFQL